MPRRKHRITEERFDELVSQGWAAPWHAYEPVLITVHPKGEKCHPDRALAYTKAEDKPRSEWKFWEFDKE